MNRGSVLETWVVARSTHTRRLYMNESPHHTHAKVGGCSHHTSFIKWEKVFLLPWQATSPGPPCILPHVLSPPRASSFLMASPLSPPLLSFFTFLFLYFIALALLVITSIWLDFLISLPSSLIVTRHNKSYQINYQTKLLLIKLT